MSGRAVGLVCPTWQLQLEAAVGPVQPLELEVETPRVAPSLQDLRVALVGPLGFPSHPACPSPYATTLGPTPMAPTRCQVRPLVLSPLPQSLQGVAHRASVPSRTQMTMCRSSLLPTLLPPFPVPRLAPCPLHLLPNHGQEPCPLWPRPWPHLPLARMVSLLPLQAQARSPDLDSGAPCRALQPAGLAPSPSQGRQERLQSVRTQTRFRLVLDLGTKPTDTPLTARKPTA